MLLCVLLLLPQSVMPILTFNGLSEDLRYFIEVDIPVSNVAEARQQCEKNGAILAYIYSQQKSMSQSLFIRFRRDQFVKAMKTLPGLFVLLFIENCNFTKLRKKFLSLKF